MNIYEKYLKWVDRFLLVSIILFVTFDVFVKAIPQFRDYAFSILVCIIYILFLMKSYLVFKVPLEPTKAMVWRMGFPITISIITGIVLWFFW